MSPGPKGTRAGTDGLRFKVPRCFYAAGIGEAHYDVNDLYTASVAHCSDSVISDRTRGGD
jgi:hypothetical protein